MTEKIGLLYDSKEKCLICGKEFPIKKVRKSRLRVIKQDEDFCTYYEAINPYFYEFIICPHCKCVFTKSFEGYLKEKDIPLRKKIIQFYSQLQDVSSLQGERNLEDALRIGKLAIITGDMIGIPHGLMAGIIMRVAWFNRFKEDAMEEKKYLEYAYEKYKKSYAEGEKVLSEEMLTYLLGELSYRLGDMGETRIWFSRLFQLRKDIGIVNKGRDRWLSIKEERKIE